MRKEAADGNHGVAVKHQAAILQKQLRNGELRRGGSYVFDEAAGKFRAMTVREIAMSNARAQLSQVENTTGSNWQTDLLRRRIRLAERGL